MRVGAPLHARSLNIAEPVGSDRMHHRASRGAGHVILTNAGDEPMAMAILSNPANRPWRLTIRHQFVFRLESSDRHKASSMQVGTITNVESVFLQCKYSVGSPRCPGPGSAHPRGPVPLRLSEHPMQDIVDEPRVRFPPRRQGTGHCRYGPEMH